MSDDRGTGRQHSRGASASTAPEESWPYARGVTSSPVPAARPAASPSRILLSAAALLLLGAHTVVALIPMDVTVQTALPWLAEHRALLRWGNELRMFAAIALVSTALAWPFPAARPAASALGRGALLLAGVVEVVAVIAEGRLAYPLPGLDPDAETVATLVTVVLGAVHAADILLAIAVGALTVDAAADAGRARGPLIGLAVPTVMLLLVASFPWAVPGAVGVLAAALLACWMLVAARTATPRAPGGSPRGDGGHRRSPLD